jgi:ADP-heptose:LPS heptosyltransferase
MFKNILILCHYNIGDICYDLVVVNPLRKQFPEAKISVLTSSGSKPIAQGYKEVDKIITFDKHGKDKGLRGRLRLMLALRKERYDLAVIMKSSLMYKFLNIPQSWSVQKYLGCSPAETGRHVADNYLGFLRSHGVDAAEAQFNFTSSPEDKEFADALFVKKGISANDTVVGILPLAAWSLKSWPIDKWNGLAEALKKQYGIKVIAFGDSDNALFKKIVLRDISPDVILTGKTILGQAIAAIRRCNVFIAPDSGLLHLASIMKVNSIGLYGPSPINYVYPYFHKNKIVSLKEKLACMPCYPGLTGCECKKRDLLFSDCMKLITVDDVLGMVRRVLKL